MRTILFGAGGQLGVDLARLCRQRGHRLLALLRSQLDITDEAATRRRIARHNPDCVINAAAYNQVDQAESDIETALRVNALAVRNIAAACGEVGAVLVHYSTDYVFDGEKGSPYKETDDAAPQSVYGLSKLMGETFVEAHCPSHYVLRVAGVFGPPGRHTKRGNFAEFVLRNCAEGAPLRIVDDQIATPTFGPALAARTLDAIEREVPFGLYHLAGGEPVSWYEFARKIARLARCASALEPTPRTRFQGKARRPRCAALSNAKVEAAGIAKMPSLDAAIAEYLILRERERATRR
ncbi:MAG: dTDP-4-dehydrorhamnose reductase [Acidobacteriia bacterium]|nr:dTDP-4-dehydrorhamnose reductase [Terriglobia bacterium]MYC67135.1 dTDP-4-dehydrorhamnose reductase [Terriglobia bacterium]